MASRMSVERKTVVRVKRRRDQPPLEAIVVKDGSKTKRLKLHDALSKISLENDAKNDHVFHFMSSVPESEISKGTGQILEKMNTFSVELKRRSEEAFASGAKRRTQQQKIAHRNRSLQRLKRIESQRPNISDTHNKNEPKQHKEPHPELKIVDCAMVDEEPPVSQISDDLCNSLLDEVERSKIATNSDDETKHEDDENVEYVYDYFCKVQRPITDSKEELHNYLDRLLSKSHASVSPRLGDLYLSLGVDGQSDEELDDNFNQESEVDEDDSNREHSDYPEADVFSEGEEEQATSDSEGGLSDYVDTSLRGQMKARHDQDNYLRNAIAYDPELDGDESDGYLADGYDF